MKTLPGPSDVRRRRVIGGAIAGCGIALLSYQFWRLAVFFMGGKAPTLDLGGWGFNVSLGLAGVVIGVLLGRIIWRIEGRPASKTKPKNGATIDGKATRLEDDG